MAALAFAGYACLSFVIAVGAAIWAAPRQHFESFFFLAFIVLYLLLYAGVLRLVRPSRKGGLRIIKAIAGFAVFGFL